MTLPKKALRESQLIKLTAGSAVKDGSHQMFGVTFIEDGVKKSAFFKKLDPKNHYPELLAKMSVAASTLKRIFQGQKSAEERLVFDDNDKLVGSLSIAIDGFKPFNYANEPVPLDTAAKEEVIPSTKTLLKKNIIEILLGRQVLDDDDPHPHNIGFAGEDAADIDFDMFWYWFTIWMKEPRPIVGVPKKRFTFTVRDWEGYPIAKDSKSFHHPSYDTPGQETLPAVLPGAVQTPLLNKILPKAYADPLQFKQLAAEKEAHQQKFAAALKIFLVCHPDMIRSRLIEVFGDLTLNYTSLDEVDVKLRSKYEEEYPELCNSKSNTGSFVDFIMKIYQKHYDKLYSVAVFYMGCSDNNYGLALPAAYEDLHQNPSYFKEILAWAQKQNDTLYSKAEPNCKHNLVEIQKRYHQVWRDAYAPTVNSLLDDAYNLTNKLLSQVSNNNSEFIKIKGKKVNDDTLTRAWELFSTMPGLSIQNIEPLIGVDKESKLREGLLLLVQFSNELKGIIHAYYDKDFKNLTEQDNLEFADRLNQLYVNYNLKIRQSLSYTRTEASEFNLIASKLKQVVEYVNFQLHLTTTDEQMKDAGSAVVSRDLIPLTHQEVLKQYSDSLFQWAKKIPAEDFNILIKDIIDSHYIPKFSSISNRHRAKPVKEYLLSSMTESSDNRLAYILSSGNEEKGALNTLIIKHLTPLMLQTYPLLKIRNAIKEGEFSKDIGVFTKHAVVVAKQDPRFIHLYSDKGMELFFKTMYEWIDNLPSSAFNRLVQNSLAQYESGLSYLNGWFGSNGSRRLEVEGYCKNSTQSKAIAMTFLKGVESSSLNSHLFQAIITAIKQDLKNNPDKLKSTGFKLINQYENEEHKYPIFEEIKTFAVEPSHKQTSYEVKEPCRAFV